VANVSYLQTDTSERSAGNARGRRTRTGRPHRGLYLLGGGLLILLAVAGMAALLLVTSHASLTTDPVALARVEMPLGGGKIESVSAFGGRDNRGVPVQLSGQQIFPVHRLAAGEQVTIQVVVKRPSSIAWLTGKTERLTLTVTAPTASLVAHYLTIPAGRPLRLQFKSAIQMYEYGLPGGPVRRVVLSSPQSEITLTRAASAGSIEIAAQPRTWETSTAGVVSFFPAGAAASAQALPVPGSRITPSTPITLTFNRPVSSVLGSNRLLPVTPSTTGSWHTLNSHTIQFQPTGYGYGLAANVSVALPNGVRLVGGLQSSSSSTGNWTVPGGSTLRLQQLLSELHYLPLSFRPRSPVPAIAIAQENAAVNPPAGRFEWRYGNVPSALHVLWAPGSFGTMTKGALMAFENDHNMTTDGVAGQAVWRALINAAMAHRASTFGYTFVFVSEGSPETETTWHNGKTVESGLVNTGIPGATTATGVYPVFEHALSVTMSGTNPDGSTYSDPGVPWVSYFNGGDALHGFIRGGYGYPQSLGCVEMPYDEAQAVYPYTPVGTLVDVSA
jgi:peptidoglycan hydrolase-like protein with peptidoglycan-binding domain